MRKIDIFGIKDKVKKEAQELIKSFESMGMALEDGAKESQATDRVYRIGQTKDVHVYYPMAIRAQGKCFDETLDYLLKRKQELAEAACYPSQKLDVTNDELVKELLTTETMPSSDKKLY